jgi:hypothetical protein
LSATRRCGFMVVVDDGGENSATTFNSAKFNYWGIVLRDNSAWKILNGRRATI